MKWLRGVTAAAVLLMVAAPAVGQDNNNIQFRYTSWGTQWGPYVLNVMDRSLLPNASYMPGTNLIDAYCVDYNNHVWTDIQWQAVATPLWDVDGLQANTRYGQLGGFAGMDLQLQYQRSAWLASHFEANRATGQQLHAAIWHLWGYNPTGWDDDPWMSRVLETDVSNFGLDNWYVVSDVAMGGDGYGGRQEFLVQTNVVPEPATIILMGTGLVAVMGLTLVMRRSVG